MNKLEPLTPTEKTWVKYVVEQYKDVDHIEFKKDCMIIHTSYESYKFTALHKNIKFSFKNIEIGKKYALKELGL